MVWVHTNHQTDLPHLIIWFWCSFVWLEICNNWRWWNKFLDKSIFQAKGQRVKRDLKLKAPLRKNNLKWVNYWFLTFIVILSWTYFHSCLLTLLQLYVFNRFFHPVIPRIWKYSILDYFSLRSKSQEDSKYDYLHLSLVWQRFSL